MIRADIFGGLKLALTKGESLKQAMISFYNAGYNKAEIEESARAVKQGFQPVMPQQPRKLAPKPKTSPAPIKPRQRVSNYGKPQMQTAVQKPVQQVSNYNQNIVQTKDKVVFGFLVFVLIVLLGSLTSVFVFKSEVTNFLNRLFV